MRQLVRAAMAMAALPLSAGSSSAAMSAAVSFSWTDTSGRAESIIVSSPRAGPAIVIRPQRGAADADLADAINRLKSGGTIHLEPGTYEIQKAPSQNDGAIVINGASDLRIEGPGATLLFSHQGDGIRISSSQRVALSGITLRYAQPGIVLGTVSAGPQGPLLTLDRPLKSGAQIQASEFKEFDRSIGNTPPFGQRKILGKAGVNLSSTSRTSAVAALSDFRPGSTVAVKLGYYQGAAIRIVDNSGMPRSNDVIVDHVNVANSSGMGIVADRMGRGLAIINSIIGPVARDNELVSIPYDGIHVSAAAGDILIEQDQISGTSDDAINVTAPLADVSAANGNSFVSKSNVSLFETGEHLTFLDGDMRQLGTTTVRKRSAIGSEGSATVEVASLIPSEARYAVLSNFSATRFAVVQSQIGHCACRAILAQGVNGIIAENHISNTTSNPIRILGSAFWKEGPGAHNIVVARNLIENSGADSPRDLIWGAISVYSETNVGGTAPKVGLTKVPINSDINIAGNIIRNASQQCFSISNSTNVTLSGNVCQNSHDLPSAALPGWKDIGQGIWINNATTSNIKSL